MRDFWDDFEAEAVLVIDVTNAFNSVNHQAALHS